MTSSFDHSSPGLDFRRIAHSLRRGTLVVDRIFDEVFPLEVRHRSNVYWTPVEVAVRAAKLLAPEPGATILDIGAGIGKFCIVAAAAVRADVRGIEHRPHLVDIARQAAVRLGVTASFEETTSIDAQDASQLDGIYLFNPFAENLCTSSSDRLDETVELGEERFQRDVAATERLLARARPGTRVVVYCGWGGTMPEGYELASRERCAGSLELWTKVRSVPPHRMALSSKGRAP